MHMLHYLKPWKRQVSDFDERLFTHHLSEYLCMEDEQLNGLVQ